MTGWRKRQVLEMAREAGFNVEQGFLLRITGIEDDLERFAELIRADEREACAKLCDELANDENTDEYINGADWCSVRIRARGQA